MARHRTHSIAFKRQVVEDYLSGEESLHGLAKHHDICRNLIRIWVGKHEAGAFDEEVEAAALLQEYEARIAALEREVGQFISRRGPRTEPRVLGEPERRRHRRGLGRRLHGCRQAPSG